MGSARQTGDMSASAPAPDDRGAVLYTAQASEAFRILQLTALAVASMILLATAGMLLLVALAPDLEPLGRAALVVLAILLVLSAAPLLVLNFRAQRMAMRVRTRGIEVRGYLRDRWLPWEQIALIETGDHWYWRRATRIVMVDGERITPVVTSYQFLLLRGEPYDDAARDARVPQVPTRAAIDLHQRWLRGELEGLRTS
jgi:hypothetical protein